MLALFGKLPARRDFIARNVPNTVLEQLEPWLQEAMAQSKASLGDAFMDAYLNAPLWRFWWSRGLAGAGLAGALMPSVDKVGRYFPLLGFAIAPSRCDFAIPSPDDATWYETLEIALLSALSQDGTLDSLIARLNRLPEAPQAGVAADPVEGSLWWTIGGAGEAARRLAFPGLPPATAFAGMLRAGSTAAAS